MTNYSSKILNNSISSLNAQQAVIANIANNIANVNTPGYTRRRVDMEAVSSRESTGLNVGNGVTVSGITRIADIYLERLLRDSKSAQASAEIVADLTSRVDSLFSLTGERQTIGNTLTAFFASINNLASNPSSIELRSEMLERGQDLVTSIRITYDELSKLQREADSRIATEVNTVNALTARIADLNGRITTLELGGGLASDERDLRDQVLNELSSKLSISTLELANGSVQVSLSNGFTLVSGINNREIAFTHNPSFADGPLPPSLDGGTLGYIVFDYDTTDNNAHLDLTNIIAKGGGSIGGLLSVRGINDPDATSPFTADGPLVAAASRVEAITRMLLTEFNRTYLGDDEDGATPGHQPSSGDLDGNPPGVYGFFDFAFNGVKDGNGDGLPNDLNALGINSFSNLLQLTFTDPRRIAAARDYDPDDNSTSFPIGDSQNLIALASLERESLAFSAGNYSFTGRFSEVYNETVTFVGNYVARAKSNFSVSDSNLRTAQYRRDGFSAVSLDEEFSSLIKFQKAFQASAKMIRVADQLIEMLVNLV